MALVPLIQPPIMRALTTDAERVIEMKQLRVVSQTEKIIFPITLTILIGLMLPSAAPLLGMFCFGNLLKESLVATSDSFSKLPKQNIPNKGAADGSIKPINMVRVIGKIIFSVCDTTLNCFISITLSASVVSALIIGGWIKGTNAMYE